MNKIAKTVLMTGTALCAAGVVLSTAGYFAGGKDFTYTSDHMYVSGGNSSSRKNLTVMKKEQIDDFTKLNVDFEDFDLDIRTSDDDHYYMEYKLEKNGRKNPLTWKDKDGELTLEESAGGSGSYYITYDLGIFSTHADLTEKKDALNTVILYIPEKAQLSEAELQLSDGDLTADQLLCKEMTLELLNGDLMLDKGEFEKFDAKLSDGDLNVKELQCTDNMQLKSGNGDVTSLLYFIILLSSLTFANSQADIFNPHLLRSFALNIQIFICVPYQALHSFCYFIPFSHGKSILSML